MNTPHRPTCLPEASADEGPALLAAAALGEDLAAADAALLSRAVAACEQCRADYAAYAALADLLAQAAPLAAPPADLRRRIIDLAQAAPPANRPARPGRAARLRRLALPGLIAALLLGLLGWNITLQRQMASQQAQATRYRAALISLMGDDDARECRLAPGGAVPASGRIFLAPSSHILGAYGKGLPAAPPGAAYHLWINGARIAQLEVDPRGRAWSIIQNLAQPGLAETAHVCITLEQAPDPAQPGQPIARCDI